MPFLRSIVRIPERELKGTHSYLDFTRYPFTIPCLGDAFKIKFKSNVTFLVGENGTGKSTILEAIAEKCGYNANRRQSRPRIPAGSQTVGLRLLDQDGLE